MLARSGEGRSDATGAKSYENFAEATVGKGSVMMKNVIPKEATDMQQQAAQEEASEKKERGEGGRAALPTRPTRPSDVLSGAR
jgi:6-phosphofructo-2-kinase/fructose-2,6-biphosphatase 4